MRQGQRGRDTGGRGCGGREQRDSKVTRVGAACVGVGADLGVGADTGGCMVAICIHSMDARGRNPNKCTT